MHCVRRIPIRSLNSLLTCVLCNGYLIDATVIIECLHSFCRSCIVRYLETNKYCPVCEVQVHKSKPLLNIRPDKTLQDIVYKLVPRLFQNEMQRRRDFYESHPDAKPTSLEQCGETAHQHLLTPDEMICLTLRYHEGTTPPRYLRCPAAVSIGHLQKLLRAKYDLSDNHRIDILYNQDCLNSSLSLMDVAYIYLWKRKGPIELTYRIYEYALKRPKLDPSVEESTPISTSNNNITGSNNNNWKEVQLRISENGEMSITGIEDTAVDFVNNENFNTEIITVIESKNNKTANKKDTPNQKIIGKNTITTSTPDVTISSGNATVISNEIKSSCSGESLFTIGKTMEDTLMSYPKPIEDAISRCTQSLTNIVNTNCITLSSATTTMVFTTINPSKCSVTISNDKGSGTVDNNVITSIAGGKNVETQSDKSFEKKIVEDKSNTQVKNTSKDKRVVILDNTKLSPPMDVPKSSETVSIASSVYNTNCTISKSTVTSTSSAVSVAHSIAATTTSSSSHATAVATSASSTNVLLPSGIKRKPDTPSPNENPPKQPKQTILNHSLTLQNLTSHPIKKQPPVSRIGTPNETSQRNNQIDMKKSQEITATSSQTPTSLSLGNNQGIRTSIAASTASLGTRTTSSEPIYNRVNMINKMATSSRPGTPLSAPNAPPQKYQPCYMPRTNYNPVINVPKVQSTSSSMSNVRQTSSVAKSDSRTGTTAADARMCYNKIDDITAVVTMSQTISINNKLNIKNKPSSPIGYKTLRDPPKSWNSQISKANLSNIVKSAPDPKNADPKNTKPAKFFKIRNNLPRYLGNPASGVKPMYQVHVSPEKPAEAPPKMEKSEIKKHSIVKIDPKTLKPISEKAPETTSLSNQSSSCTSDLKINTSSVPIFSPLKLQSSPKSERKSPKSPHSPKLKSTSPPNKREKLNLNFTPPNPFVPNLTSQTLNPNHFLYHSGPPGFPSYDPRVMAAYHSLFYGPLPSSCIPALTMDLNQRNSFDMVTPPSPKMGSLSGSHSPQSLMSQQQMPKSPQSVSLLSKTQVMTSTKTTASSTLSKPQMTTKKSNSEKSILNAVEKLTQNRAKEIVKNVLVNNNASDKTNSSDVTSKRDSAKPKSDIEKQNTAPVNSSFSNVKNNEVKAPPSDAKDKEKVAEEKVKENAASNVGKDVSKETGEKVDNKGNNKSEVAREASEESRQTCDKKKQEEESSKKDAVKDSNSGTDSGGEKKDEKSTEETDPEPSKTPATAISPENNQLKELNCNLKTVAAKTTTVKVTDKQCDDKSTANNNTTNSSLSVV